MLRTLSITILFVSATLVGCGRSPQTYRDDSVVRPEKQAHRRRPSVNYRQSENENLLVLIVDLSPSFAELLGPEGGAFEWMLKVVQEYKRSHPGDEGRLVIAQISNGGSPLVWEGRPSRLQQSYDSADDFRAYLEAQADTAGGTALYESLSSSIDFVLRHPTVRSGQSTVDVIVISDMVDSTGDAAAETELTEKIGQLAQQSGTIGMYYVHPDVTQHWEELLHGNGYPTMHFTSIIDRFPAIPEFH